MSLEPIPLVLASSNAGKLLEFVDLFGPRFALRTQASLGVADADETGLTFIENALIKARHAAQHTGLPALADDSGLVVDALDGAPGLLSARYAGLHGDDAANIARLLDAMRDVPPTQRQARFTCVLALLRHADDPEPLIAQGSWHGRILDAGRGNGGFGYDPVFAADGSDLSAAQMEPAAKRLESHRGRALETLRLQLAALAPETWVNGRAAGPGP